jgi:hypothetical protein
MTGRRRLPDGLNVYYQRDVDHPETGPVSASIRECPAVTGVGGSFGEAYQSVVAAALEAKL